MNARDHLALLARFDSLPDDAILPDATVALLLATSPWTLRRTDPVKRIKISARRYGRRVGDLRRLVRGETAAA